MNNDMTVVVIVFVFEVIYIISEKFFHPVFFFF